MGTASLTDGPGVTVSEPSDADDVRPVFDRLAADWRAGTETTSNLREVLMHPSHLRIIGLGQPALPFIFADLRRGGGPWFLALASITRADPLDPADRPDGKALRRAWLDWGTRHGYVEAEPGA